MTAIPSRALLEELGLTEANGWRWIRRAEQLGLLKRRVRIGGTGGSLSEVDLVVPLDRLRERVAGSFRRPKGAPSRRPPSDGRCTATCGRSLPPRCHHRCVGADSHSGRHEFISPCSEDRVGIHREAPR
jgi:hypothetical protein